MTGCLHSRQPMPAVVHPLTTQSRVVRVRVDLVQRPHGAAVRVALVRAAHARGVRLHRADLLRDLGGFLAHQDRVAVGLRHLLPVETRHFRRLGQQRTPARGGSRGASLRGSRTAARDRRATGSACRSASRARPRAPRRRRAPGTPFEARRICGPFSRRAFSPRPSPCPRSPARCRRCG